MIFRGLCGISWKENLICGNFRGNITERMESIQLIRSFKKLELNFIEILDNFPF